MVEKTYSLSDEEKKLVAEFLKNEKLVATIKKVMFKNVSRQINIEEPLNHWVYGVDRTMDNDKYANLIRMVAQAQTEVYEAFENLNDALDVVVEESEPLNESR